MAKKTQASVIRDQFDGTIIERPIEAANKAALAGIGLAAQLRNHVASQYDDFVRDGEKVRDRFEDSLDDLQNRVTDQVKTKRNQVEMRVTRTLKTVLDHSPIATSSDVDKLNTKFDKVLLQLTK